MVGTCLTPTVVLCNKNPRQGKGSSGAQVLREERMSPAQGLTAGTAKAGPRARTSWLQGRESCSTMLQGLQGEQPQGQAGKLSKLLGFLNDVFKDVFCSSRLYCQSSLELKGEVTQLPITPQELQPVCPSVWLVLQSNKVKSYLKTHQN